MLTMVVAVAAGTKVVAVTVVVVVVVRGARVVVVTAVDFWVVMAVTLMVLVEVMVVEGMVVDLVVVVVVETVRVWVAEMVLVVVVAPVVTMVPHDRPAGSPGARTASLEPALGVRSGGGAAVGRAAESGTVMVCGASRFTLLKVASLVLDQKSVID